MGNEKTRTIRQIDGTLSMSVAVLCGVFIGLTCACFLVVSVWLSVQQQTLRFERAVSDVSVAAMRMFHASNSFHGLGVVAPAAVSAETLAGRKLATNARAEDGTDRHKDLITAIRRFNKKSKRLKAFFQYASTPPALTWGEFTEYVVWLTGIAKIPQEVQTVWKSEDSGRTISAMMEHQGKTCMFLCVTPDLSEEEKYASLIRMNEIAVNDLQPQLNALSSTVVKWQNRNIQATRNAILLAFGMLLLAVAVIWRGLIMPMLRRLAIAKLELANQNTRLERRVAERTETLSTALEIAKDAAEARKNFLANMSHELRTPMNGVLGMAALLSSSKLDENQRANLDVITKSGTLLLRIIDDVLDMSGLSAGKLKITRHEVVLADVIEDVVKLLKPVAEAKNLRLDLDLVHASRDPVLIDPERFSQVMNNLIGNALKFTEEGGVCVCLQEADSSDGTWTAISIQDTGIGIPDTDLHRIFGQFERVRHGKVISGAGLGLAISQSLIQEMGGRISVASIEGKGSQFTVTLPLERAHAAAKFSGIEHLAAG